MSLPVLLRDVADEVDALGDEWCSRINRTTGELAGATSDHWTLAAETTKDNPRNQPQWEQDLLADLRKVLDSDDWLVLPGKDELDEYRVMEEFCHTVENRLLRDELTHAIVGKGAFRRFKTVIERNNIREKWFEFRDLELLKVVREWLNVNKIPFRET